MSAVRRIIHDQYKSAHAKVQFVNICDELKHPKHGDSKLNRKILLDITTLGLFLIVIFFVGILSIFALTGITHAYHNHSELSDFISLDTLYHIPILTFAFILIWFILVLIRQGVFFYLNFESPCLGFSTLVADVYNDCTYCVS